MRYLIIIFALVGCSKQTPEYIQATINADDIEIGLVNEHQSFTAHVDQTKTVKLLENQEYTLVISSEYEQSFEILLNFNGLFRRQTYKVEDELITTLSTDRY